MQPHHPLTGTRQLTLGAALCLLTCYGIGCNRPALQPDQNPSVPPTPAEEVAFPLLRVVACGADPAGQRVAVSFNAPTTHEPTKLILIDIATGDVSTVAEGRFLSWSADGNEIAHLRYCDGRLTVHDVLAGTDRPVDWVAAPVYARWSPDGERVALVSLRDEGGQTRHCLWVAQSDGSGPIKLADWVDMSNFLFTWGRESSYVYLRGIPTYDDGTVFAKVSVPSGEMQVLVRGHISYALHLSESNNCAFYMRREAPGDQWELWTLDISTLETRPVAGPSAHIQPGTIACSPNGDLAALSDTSGRLWLVHVDTGESEIVAEQGRVPLWLPGIDRGFVFLADEASEGQSRVAMYHVPELGTQPTFIARF